MTLPEPDPVAPAPDSKAAKRLRLRKEGWLAGSCLGIGLLALPGLIYAFGATVLGAYGGGPHIGSFYGDFFRNLASGSFRTWLIVLTPYLLVVALRLIFRPRTTQPPPPSSDPDSAVEPPGRAPDAAPQGRREPFVSP